MIIFIFGTTAELIKLSPIMRLLEQRNLPFETWCTGQQFEELDFSIRSLGVGQVDHWIAKGFRRQSLTKLIQVPFWLLTCSLWFVKNQRSLRSRLGNQKTIFIVHGDTMTTVVGGVLGRLLGQKVAHVEAGLRSHDWRNPFPEELDRIIAAKLSRLHFAPDETAVKNLKGVRGVIVNTFGNTAMDALKLRIHNPASDLQTGHGLILLHRSEFLRDAALVQKTYLLIKDLSEESKIVVVADALSRAVLERLELVALLERSPNIEIIGKQPHQAFINLIVNSDYVITDSGGVQEECAALGKPCFLHRRATERIDGLGRNCVLTLMDVGNLKNLVSNFRSFHFPAQIDSSSPTSVIVDILQTEVA